MATLLFFYTRAMVAKHRKAVEGRRPVMGVEIPVCSQVHATTRRTQLTDGSEVLAAHGLGGEFL